MNNEIIYTNLSAKPKQTTATPTPKAPAEAPVSQVKRIRIGWGAEGHKGVAAQSAEQFNTSTDNEQQPRREVGESFAPRVRL